MNLADQTLASVSNRLARAKQDGKSGIYLPFNQVDILLDLADPQEGDASHVRAIVRAVAGLIGLTEHAVLGSSVARRVVRARNAVCYLAHHHHGMGHRALGEILRRNEGTVRTCVERATLAIESGDHRMTDLVDRARQRAGL